MSGVPNPPSVIVPFAADAPDPAFITLPIPIDSQIGVLPGAASFTDGFPPLTMPAAGDPTYVPPFGQDMNGILYTLSAFCAMLQAGQLCVWNDEAQYAWGGYSLGALLRKVDGTGFWFNAVEGNETDPDAGGAGWIGWSPAGVSIGYVLAVLPAGTSHDYDAGGAFTQSINALDLNPTGGDATVDGFIVGADGQRVLITNVNASNAVNLPVLTGSTATKQMRGLPGGVTLLQNMSITIQYSAGVGKWLQVL